MVQVLPRLVLLASRDTSSSAPQILAKEERTAKDEKEQLYP
jgi:hypothetical protein